MALFDHYVKPGVYTSVVLNDTGSPVFGDGLITVFIGEGQEQFTFNDVELHRGSSAITDDKVVGENISDQIDGLTRTFQLSYFPVVTGTGYGLLTNDPLKVKVLANGVPAVLVSLNGSTGVIQTQDILPLGTNLEVTYYFKRTDTQVVNEDLSYQIPTFASALIQGILFSVSVPGASGNGVSVTLTDTPATDLQAVSWVGSSAPGALTNSIAISTVKSDGTTVRTLEEVVTLVAAGIPTASVGYLTAALQTTGLSPSAITALEATPAAVATETALTSGSGMNTNLTFKTAYTPIVDGTNGGVITITPGDVKVSVNGVSVQVSAVDGLNGLITLAAPVTAGATLTVTYSYNKYQDTYDLLPANNIVEITQVGLGPGRSDFVENVDYVLNNLLSSNGSTFSTIQWGAASTIQAGHTTAGSVAFDGGYINTTLVDQKVFLRPASGVSNSTNTTFTLEDSPVDGSGLRRVTDDPTKVLVYVGTNPVSALASGPVRVVRLSGNSRTITLFNAPASNQNVYATYYRSALDAHTYTATVQIPGIPGQGTYTLTDDFGRFLPVTSVLPTAYGSMPVGTDGYVTDGAFGDTGVVWPTSKSDLTIVSGQADETVTLEFSNTLTRTTVNGVQGTLVIQGLQFMAQNPTSAINSVQLSLVGGTPTADNNAVTVNATGAPGGHPLITIQIEKSDNSTRTLADIVNLFSAQTITISTACGRALCTAVTGTNTTVAATAGGPYTFGDANAAPGSIQGVTPVVVSYSNQFTVSSTLSGGSSGTGYLGQTYIDPVTDLQFTIVDPQISGSAQLAAYGLQTAPSPNYYFQQGDTLKIRVAGANVTEASRVTGTNQTIDIPGLRTKVISTLGMNSGDTAIIETYKGGTEPNVGDFYSISFTTQKTAEDMALKLYTNDADGYAQYGDPNPSNRISMAINLFLQNGGQTYGVIQVPKQQGLSYASDAAFIAALQTLQKNLPGMERKASIIVPLSTSAPVHGALSQHLIKMDSARMQGEAQGFIGFSSTTTPTLGRIAARGLKNKRVVAVAPFVLGINVQDTATGVSTEQPVSGEFLAAAAAGLRCAPQNDSATSLTRQPVSGFTAALYTYDEPTMDLMGADGLCVFVNSSGVLKCRHYKTTDPSTRLTSEPTVTTSIDEVTQTLRKALDPFIGLKNVASLRNNIAIVVNSVLASKVRSEIIDAYLAPIVTQDASDPTLVHVVASVKPIFATLYIDVKLTVTTSL